MPYELRKDPQRWLCVEEWDCELEGRVHVAVTSLSDGQSFEELFSYKGKHRLERSAGIECSSLDIDTDQPAWSLSAMASAAHKRLDVFVHVDADGRRNKRVKAQMFNVGLELDLNKQQALVRIMDSDAPCPMRCEVQGDLPAEGWPLEVHGALSTTEEVPGMVRTVIRHDVVIRFQPWRLALSLARALELICQSLDKFRGYVKPAYLDRFEQLQPEHVLAILIKESNLDPEAYVGSYRERGRPKPPTDLGQYTKAAGLGQITKGSANEIRRMARAYLDQSPGSDHGANPFLTAGTDTENVAARAARWDIEANVDMVVLILLEKVAREADFELALRNYGPAAKEPDYGANIQAGAALIKKLAGCRGKSCARESLLDWAHGLKWIHWDLNNPMPPKEPKEDLLVREKIHDLVT